MAQNLNSCPDGHAQLVTALASQAAQAGNYPAVWPADTATSCVRWSALHELQFVVANLSSCPRPPIRTLVGMDWCFNGWGGLYGSYDQDQLVARKMCEVQGLPYVSADFVLEGGSIHVDGEG